MNTLSHLASSPDPAPSQGLVETLCLPNGDWIVASQDRFWLHRNMMSGLNLFSEALSDPGDPDRTRQVLAGAIASALGKARQHSPARAAPSVQRHVWSLASAYQTTHATPAILRQVAARFDTEGRGELADYCRHGADEEAGHDDLALRDLAALGLRAEAFVAEVQPPNALRLVALFESLADGPEPVAVLGYAYALERMALFTTAEGIKAIEAILPHGVKATRCLRVHSAAGTDLRHVRESLDFMATLPAGDRRAICHATFATVSIMAETPDTPRDEVMDALMAKFRVESAMH